MTDAIHLSNNAPLVDPETIANRYKDDFVAATAILNAEASLPAMIESEADLERCVKHVKDARMVEKKLDGHRATEKAVFDKAGKDVQALFKPRIDKLSATKGVAEGIITRYQNKKAEEERIKAKEAADRERAEAAKRAEAAAAMEGMGLDDVAETVLQAGIDSERSAAKLDRLATGSAADLVRAQTTEGTASVKAGIAFEITDQAALRKSLGDLGPFFNVTHIEQAIRGFVAFEKKQGKTAANLDGSIAGVRFYAETKAMIR